MVMRIAPWSNDPLWILHYTLHVTFLSPSVFHNRYTCISFTLVYTATTVPHCPTISPLVCAEKEVQKTFVLRAYIRFTASTLSTHPVYCVLQTGRGGERDKKPKEKKKHTKQKWRIFSADEFLMSCTREKWRGRARAVKWRKDKKK